MAIERTYLHVDGPPGAGKTTLVERLLEACSPGDAMVARCRQVGGASALVQRRPAHDSELRRYEQAGAVHVVRLQFGPEQRATDAFWATRFVSEWSRAIVFEGPLPFDIDPDLHVYVARPPPDGRPVLARIARNDSADLAALFEMVRRAIEGPLRGGPGILRPLPGVWTGTVLERTESGVRIREELRGRMLRQLERLRSLPPEPPRMEWAISPEYAGIDQAGVVVVNVRDDAERPWAEELARDARRLRADRAVFADVRPRWRTPIMVRIAKLADARDRGTRDVMARIRRTLLRQ